MARERLGYGADDHGDYDENNGHNDHNNHNDHTAHNAHNDAESEEHDRRQQTGYGPDNTAQYQRERHDWRDMDASDIALAGPVDLISSFRNPSRRVDNAPARQYGVMYKAMTDLVENEHQGLADPATRERAINFSMAMVQEPTRELCAFYWNCIDYQEQDAQHGRENPHRTQLEHHYGPGWHNMAVAAYEETSRRMQLAAHITYSGLIDGNQFDINISRMAMKNAGGDLEAFAAGNTRSFHDLNIGYGHDLTKTSPEDVVAHNRRSIDAAIKYSGANSYLIANPNTQDECRRILAAHLIERDLLYTASLNEIAATRHQISEIHNDDAVQEIIDSHQAQAHQLRTDRAVDHSMVLADPDNDHAILHFQELMQHLTSMRQESENLPSLLDAARHENDAHENDAHENEEGEEDHTETATDHRADHRADHGADHRADHRADHGADHRADNREKDLTGEKVFYRPEELAGKSADELMADFREEGNTDGASVLDFARRASQAGRQELEHTINQHLSADLFPQEVSAMGRLAHGFREFKAQLGNVQHQEHPSWKQEQSPIETYLTACHQLSLGQRITAMGLRDNNSDLVESGTALMDGASSGLADYAATGADPQGNYKTGMTCGPGENTYQRQREYLESMTSHAGSNPAHRQEILEFMAERIAAGNLEAMYGDVQKSMSATRNNMVAREVIWNLTQYTIMRDTEGLVEDAARALLEDNRRTWNMTREHTASLCDNLSYSCRQKNFQVGFDMDVRFIIGNEKHQAEYQQYHNIPNDGQRPLHEVWTRRLTQEPALVKFAAAYGAVSDEDYGLSLAKQGIEATLNEEQARALRDISARYRNRFRR